LPSSSWTAEFLRDERRVRDRRAGGQHLRAGHDDPVVVLADDVDVDVLDLVHRLVAVDRRVDEARG
jgi:hypothetical protein